MISEKRKKGHRLGKSVMVSKNKKGWGTSCPPPVDRGDNAKLKKSHCGQEGDGARRTILWKKRRKEGSQRSEQEGGEKDGCSERQRMCKSLLLGSKAQPTCGWTIGGTVDGFGQWGEVFTKNPEGGEKGGGLLGAGAFTGKKEHRKALFSVTRGGRGGTPRKTGEGESLAA